MSGERGRGERAYLAATRAFSVVLLAIGVLVLVVTLTNGGGPASVGFLLGLALLAVGGARLWLATMGGR